MTEAMRRWWLDRYSLEEIRALAKRMWPDDGRLVEKVAKTIRKLAT